MTPATLTPDLQRIVEALKACRERYVIVDVGYGHDLVEVWDLDLPAGERTVFQNNRDECLAYIDARCAEAMVRAIREPSNEILAAGLDWAVDGTATLDVRDQWVAMCDAILGETQP